MNTMLMNLMYAKFQDLMNREDGQDLVEYALLVSLIALGCIAAITPLTTAITTVFNNISTSI